MSKQRKNILIWILSDWKSINFLYDNRMGDSHSVHKIQPNVEIILQIMQNQGLYYNYKKLRY